MKAGAEAAAANAGSRAKLPREAQQMRAWAVVRWQHVAAAVNPFEIEEIMALRADRLKNEHLLGSMPLVVITRGLPDEEGPDAAAREAEHRQDHAVLALLSTRGQLVIAAGSRHHVQLDEPQLVITTIQQAVNEVAKGSRAGRVLRELQDE